jgi:hypothetical protein
MGAVDDTRPAGRATREFDRSFDAFCPGIGKKDLIQIGHVFQQAFGQHAGQRRNVELHQVREVAIEDALQGLAQRRMIPSDCKNAKSAQ